MARELIDDTLRVWLGLNAQKTESAVRVPLALDIASMSALWQTRTRSLFLFQEIRGDEDESAITKASFIGRDLMFLDDVVEAPITLYINSPGGDITGGLALIQIMRNLRSPVHTVVMGQAVSMAAIVAVAGDRRLAYPWARWLLHRGKAEAGGDADDIAIAAKELKILDGYADFLLTQRTRIPAERLKRFQQKDRWFGTDEAVKWGMVDHIVVPRKGPEKWIPDRVFLKSLREKEDEDERDDDPTAAKAVETKETPT
jgi:ATP-dependent Clp protease protease subunit